MYAIANATVDILRGTTVDDWGDPQDSGEVIAEGVPASILVRNRTAIGTNDQDPRIVQVITCSMPALTDVRVDDQLHDTTHEITYAVITVLQTNAIGRIPDLSLELSRIT